MRTTISSTYLQNQPTLQIRSNMAVSLNITANPLDLALNQLFQMAARVNKKRGFLFVSKVLGKHVPVHPLKPLLTSGILAIEYFEQMTGQVVLTKPTIVSGLTSEDSHTINKAYELLSELNLQLNQAPIIIGFAETATSLGHGFFDAIEDALYIHTTREKVKGAVSNIVFEEEHSHAVDQYCFIDHNDIDNGKPIILVDDEITTGKTTLNIIRNIHSKFPRKNYSIISILDWRSQENRQKFLELETELDITIHTLSLIQGEMEFAGEPLDRTNYDYLPAPQHMKKTYNVLDVSSYFTKSCYDDETLTIPYINETGRFGINQVDKEVIELACAKAGNYIRSFRNGSKTLCLGTGEFMYLPMRLASYLGEGVNYHSSTRSPIHPEEIQNYAIQNGFTFPNPEDLAITHYIYNIPKNHYDEVFVFFEKEVSHTSLNRLLEIFADRNIQHVNIVVLSKERSGVGEEYSN